MPQSKPGRLAKAISSAEETSSRRKREKSSDPAGETTSGWKKRLSIPRNPPPAEDEKETVQQSTGTSFPHAESKPAEAKLPESAASSSFPENSSVAEESVTPAASLEKFAELAPLSKADPDVQVLPIDSPVKLEAKVEITISETPVVDQPSPAAAFVPGSDQPPDGAEVMAAIASLSPATEVSETVKTAKTDGDTPIGALATVLAAVRAVCKGPRWIADPVPLSDGDSHLLLELEMEKAYAAFAAAESARNPLPAAVAESDPPALETAIVLASPQSSAESQLSSVSVHEEAISAPEPKDTASSEASDVSSAAQPVFTAAAEPEEQPVELVATSTVQPAANETETGGGTPEPAASIGFRDIAYAAAASASSVASEPNRTSVSSSVVESSASQEVDAAPKAVDELPVQPESAASQPAAEATSSPASSEPVSGSQESQLASAWQNWRQIRESIIGQQLPSQVADVATAAFKQIREEQKEQTDTNGKDAETSEENRAVAEASTIAGIVDSVLSELKPKLMEEIAKKLASERK